MLVVIGNGSDWFVHHLIRNWSDDGFHSSAYHHRWLLWQVVAHSSVTVTVGNIIHGISTAIGSNVRVGALDNIFMGRGLHTVLQTTDSVGSLESGQG